MKGKKHYYNVLVYESLFSNDTKSMNTGTGRVVLTSNKEKTIVQGASVSQRIGRNISKGVRIEVVQVAHSTKPTCWLVIIPKFRSRIDVVLYGRPIRKFNMKKISKLVCIHQSNDAIHSAELNMSKMRQSRKFSIRKTNYFSEFSAIDNWLHSGGYGMQQERTSQFGVTRQVPCRCQRGSTVMQNKVHEFLMTGKDKSNSPRGTKHSHGNEGRN